MNFLYRFGTSLTNVFTQTFRTLSLWQWLILIAIPPLIVLLYFLKLRRQPLEVPSTYLWQKTIEDLHVNSLWQRLRQNLLLLLQLLLILFAILACLRPSWMNSQLMDDRYVFILDTSASMSATDVSPTRLEMAKQQVTELIDQRMKPGSVAMVISFSDRARVEQPFTDNRNLLRRKVRAIEATQRSSDLSEALRVAAALANPGRTAEDASRDVATAEALPATLLIFSDGRFHATPQFAMGNLKPVYVPIGSATAQNVGIVAFSGTISPEKPDQLQLFGRLQNFGDQKVIVDANLMGVARDDAAAKPQLIDAAQVELGPNETRGVEFRVDALLTGQVSLEIAQPDALALDNVAYVAINRRRPARLLLVTERNDALQTVLQTSSSQKLAETRIETPAFLATPEYKQSTESSSFDLIIYDRCRPEAMPRCNTCFIGAIPSDARWIAEAAQELPQIIDTDRSHPLMRFVELGDIKWIVQATPLKIPAGGHGLIESHVGPLMGVAPREGFEDVVVGFPIVTQNAAGEREANTDWPIRISFPVFVGNLISYLGGASAEGNSTSTQPGQPVSLFTESPVETLRVESPQREASELTRGARNAFLYGKTDTIGVYKVREGQASDITQRFAVNLFDEIESNIRPSTELQTKYEKIEGKPAWESTRREGWKYLLLIALGILLLEWYVYNRRVYI